MPGQMCWLPKLGGNGEKILHLRLSQGDRWLPYTSPQFSQYRQPDSSLKPVLPGGKDIPLSKGMPTAQILLEQNWAYVPTDQAYDPNPELIYKGHNPAAGSEPINAYARAKEFGLVQ